MGVDDDSRLGRSWVKLAVRGPCIAIEAVAWQAQRRGPASGRWRPSHAARLGGLRSLRARVGADWQHSADQCGTRWPQGHCGAAAGLGRRPACQDLGESARPLPLGRTARGRHRWDEDRDAGGGGIMGCWVANGWQARGGAIVMSRGLWSLRFRGLAGCPHGIDQGGLVWPQEHCGAAAGPGRRPGG